LRVAVATARAGRGAAVTTDSGGSVLGLEWWKMDSNAAERWRARLPSLTTRHARGPPLLLAREVARAEWKPQSKPGVVVATLREHGAAVHRIAVSQDQSFFATASADGTTKVWGTVGLERDANPRSLATYTAQPGEIVDACNLDNTRSVATASDAGTVHVWRVEVRTNTHTRSPS
jgi:WD40 repeat protein